MTSWSSCVSAVFRQLGIVGWTLLGQPLFPGHQGPIWWEPAEKEELSVTREHPGDQGCTDNAVTEAFSIELKRNLIKTKIALIG